MKHIRLLLLFVGLLFLQSIYYSQVPYVPTPENVVEGMLKVAQVTDKDVVYDLGCGDGRIVVMAAKKYGARAIGVDNNPERIKDSWANAKQNGVTNKVDFREQNLFDINLRDATVVTLYLLTEVNLKLRPKLFQELRPGTRVVSHSFSMDTWDPDSLLEIDGRSVYYWKMPYNFSGKWDIKMQGDKNKTESYTLHLDQVFQKVDGALESGNKKFYITEPVLKDDMLRFTVVQNHNGSMRKMKYTARLNKDNQIQGTIETDDGGAAGQNFTAKRQEGTMKPLDPEIKGTGL